MEEETKITEREPALPNTGTTTDVVSRDELEEYRRPDEEEVREPWRVTATPMSGFWRPAIALLILGALALLLARGIF